VLSSTISHYVNIFFIDVWKQLHWMKLLPYKLMQTATTNSKQWKYNYCYLHVYFFT